MGVVVSALVGIAVLTLIVGVDLWPDRSHPCDAQYFRPHPANSFASDA